MILFHMGQDGILMNPDEFITETRKNINAELVDFFKRRINEISDSSIRRLKEIVPTNHKDWPDSFPALDSIFRNLSD